MTTFFSVLPAWKRVIIGLANRVFCPNSGLQQCKYPRVLYRVVLQHFQELLVALLCDEDALGRGDAAAAGQAVVKCDLSLLQLLFPTILEAVFDI